MKTPFRRRGFPALWCGLGLLTALNSGSGTAVAAPEKPATRPAAAAAPGAASPSGAKAAPDSVAIQAQIVVPEGRLGRGSAIEVRFPGPMAEASPAGKEVAAESVLDIKPALPGRFRWQSTRSGTLELGTLLPPGQNYRITLKAGLKDAQGRPVTAPAATAATPDFTMRESTPRWFYPASETTLQPEITLYFNDAVSAAEVAKAGAFSDKEGRRIPVTAARPDVSALGRNPPVYGTWEQQQKKQSGEKEREDSSGEEDRPATPPRAESIDPPKAELVESDTDGLPVSVVRVKPASPLPAGLDWAFILPKGIPNQSGKARTAAPVRIVYGSVTAFQLAKITAVPMLDEDSEIQFGFNKKLPELDAGKVPPGIRISPAPENLTWTVSGQMVTAKGAFRHGTGYTAQVDRGLPAADGMILEQGRGETLKFAAHEPQLALPAFDHAQWLGGKGGFAFSSANLKKASVKIKKADPGSVIYLLNGYATYESDSDHPDAYGHTRLPWSVVPGKTVWEKEFPSQAELNHSERSGFTWDEAAGGKRQPGIYFISIEGQPRREVDSTRVLGAQSVVQLSDIGLAWKYAGAEALIYAFSHTSGQPLPGATLRSYTHDNELSETVTTGADGMAKMAFGKARWLIAQAGEDLRGVQFNGDATELNRWAFDLPVDDAESNALPSREMIIFTERPVYQPGETFFFKAITRLHQSVTLSIPSEKKAKLFLFDPQNRTVLDRDIEFSDTGSFSDGLRLPEQGVGWYRLRIEFPAPPKPAPAAGTAPAAADSAAEGTEEAGNDGDGEETEDGEPQPQRYEQMLLVQEYQPNAFRITFDDAAVKRSGETLSVPVRAAYLMGKALDGSEMKWTANLSQSPFRPDGYEDYRFCNARSYYVWDGSQYQSMKEEAALQPLMTGQGTVKLSPKGETLLEAKVPATFGVPGPKLMVINAEITDLNQQTIAEGWQHTEHTSDFYLGVRRPANAVNAGMEVPLSLVAVDAQGGRRKTAVPVKVKIERLAWNAVRVQTAGGGTDVRNDLTFVPVGEEDLTVQPELGREEAWTFKPQAAGTHNLTFTAADSSGREVRTVVSIDVFSPQEQVWRQNDGVKVELLADKDRYQPGETAKVVVKSPFSGTALVTVERDRVLRSELKKVETGGAIELKVEDSWAPNVFVSVLQVRGGAEDPRAHPEPDYRVGYCSLSVESQRDLLKIDLTPAQSEVRPGSLVEVAATVRDAAGNPVPEAELALWAVDEGILSLMPWEVPDPAGTFHYDSPLAVRTGISLQRLLPEDPEKLDFVNKGFVIGGGGDLEGTGKVMRQNFKPTAYWHGMLRTGADGVVRVSFPAPDNLTEFRLAAVATEGVSRFGKAEGRFKVNQPLMLEPALPRFANAGDEITLKAVLHNTTEKEGELTVELAGDGRIQILDPANRQPLKESKAVRTVHLAAQQSKAVPFAVRFTADGPLALQWKASCATEPLLTDSVESKFAVGIAEPLIRDVRFASLASTRSGANLLEKVSPELLEGDGQVTVTLANSRLLEGAEAVERLLHYPYGCAEQTMSSMLPWLTLRDLKQVLPSLNRPDQEIANVIQKGCDRLLSMQTASGGLGYWPKDTEPSLWASAHGALGLTLASRSGAQVPADRLEKLTQWLSQSLRDTASVKNTWELTERAYAAYALALAGKAEPGYHEVLFNQRQNLSPDALALLALAVAESEGPAEMAKTAITESRSKKTDLWWGGQSTEAMRAMALLKLKDPAADEAMGRLMNTRSPRGDWSHTFANSWALMALSQEARMTPALKEGQTCTLSLNGKSQEITLPGTPASKTVTLSWQAGAELPVLTATMPTGQRLFAKVETARRAPAGEQPARSSGFGITRSWRKVAPDGTLSEPGALRTGDLVQVTLKLDIPEGGEYLSIDDPLPATFEAVNPNFTSMVSGTVARSDAALPTWFSDYTEMRRDRVLFFRNYFSEQGRYQVNYLARVIAEGTVMVPAAKIELMYDPARFGLSPARKLTTEAATDGSMAGR